MNSPYNCPECEGEGEAVCECCGSDLGDCQACQGTGWDPEYVDVAAFRKAGKALNTRMSNDGCFGLSYEWIEGGQRLGRTGGKKYGSVAVKEFLWPDTEGE